MSTLNRSLKTTIEEKMLAVKIAAQAGDVDTAIFCLLDVFAALGRDAAQKAWLAHHDDEDSDEQMEEAENELVFTCLKSSWSGIYAELPGQIEWVLREAFQDEFLRCEDPVDWAEMNDWGLDDLETQA